MTEVELAKQNQMPKDPSSSSSSSTGSSASYEEDESHERRHKTWRERGFGLVYEVCEERMEDVFDRIGYVVSRYPWLIILASLILVGATAPGLSMLEDNNTFADIWVPQDSPGVRHFRFYTENYGSGFRITQLIAASPDEEEPSEPSVNILTKAFLEECLRLTNDVFALAPGDIDYEDICARPQGDGTPCLISNVFSLWNYDEEAFEALSLDEVLDDLLAAKVDGTFQDLGSFFGNLVVDSNGRPQSATGLRSTWFTVDGESETSQETLDSLEWEAAFLEITRLEAAELYPDLSLYPNAARSGSDENSASIGGDVALLNVTFVLIILYVIWVLAKRDQVESRMFIGFMGVISVALSIGICFGVGGYAGLPFVGPVRVVPFLLIVIGVDDMFIIIENFRQTSHKLKPEARVQQALKRSGSAILFTTTTDIVALAVGTTSRFPALEYFVLYTLIGVLADFTLQISFFTACLTIDARRSASRRKDCCCCCFTCACAHSPLPAGAGDEEAAQEEKKARVNPNAPVMNPESESLSTILFREYYAPFLGKPLVKVVVVVIAAVYLGVMIWSATNLEQTFDISDIAGPDSYLATFSEQTKSQFPTAYQGVQLVSLPELDFSDPAQAARYLELLDEIRADPMFVPGFTVSWLEAFVDFVAPFEAPGPGYGAPSYVLENGIPVPSEAFYEALDFFLDGPGGRFVDDIIFKDDVIYTSQSSTAIWAANSTADEVAQMRESRRVVVEDDEHAFLFNFAFLNSEATAIVVIEGVGELVTGLLGVTLLSLLFLHPVASAIVFVSILLIQAGVLGVMSFWNVAVNSVSVANLIISIGLSIEFVGHMSHTMVAVQGTTRNDRMTMALNTMGASIMNGGLSLCIGVLPLAFSKSGIFIVFFKMIFTVCALGLIAALVFLPVALSYIIPLDPPSGSAAKAVTKAAADAPSSKGESAAPSGSSAAATTTGTSSSLSPSPLLQDDHEEDDSYTSSSSSSESEDDDKAPNGEAAQPVAV